MCLPIVSLESRLVERNEAGSSKRCCERRNTMVNDLRETNGADDEEPSRARESSSPERSSPDSFKPKPLWSEMSLPLLADQCLREVDNYRQGEPYTEAYGLELLRRATIQDDQEAWARIQHCFGETVRGWLRHHPQREVAYHLQSEENYVAQTFERFWQATAFKQRVEFSTLAAALQYLRASLNGAILDMLRAYMRPREVSLPGPGEPGEPLVEDSIDDNEVWDILHVLLSNPREQRLAYLLFYCGLKPREIVRFCPQEWSTVQEIYRLRCTMMVRLLRVADQLHWRLNQGDLL
jgi:DNA-directed RNA polymerase specialized sigma24 family protein